VLSKVEANRNHILKSCCFYRDAVMQGKKNLRINKLARVGMAEFLQGVFMSLEISGFTNCMACRRCDLVKLCHASASLLLRKQMLL